MNVVGIGQCAFDHLFVIDSFPPADTKKEISTWSVSGGGPVATALVCLSRLGVSCRFHGITGDDYFAHRIHESLSVEGIDVDGLLMRKDASSQVAFIAVEQSGGKRTIFWKRPSGPPLEPREMAADFLDGADFLLLDGLMSDVSLFAARQARSRGIPVMLDAGRLRQGMVELAQNCDYVVCSEEFAREFTEGDGQFDPLRALERMREFHGAVVTITLGSAGSVTVCKDGILTIPAYTVDAVDTTGAGDVFHGAYIYGLLQNMRMKEVVRFASACAALKCRKPGRAGIPRLDEISCFMDGKNRQPRKLS